jgi:hypothetical protein
MAVGWDINIVGHDVKPASWFLAHHKNVRIHPRAQIDATEGSLNTLGWVKSVTVNVRTSETWTASERGVNTLLDGHARVILALSRGEETPVPIEYVDLNGEQEDLFLLIVDALVEMAMKDKQKLDALLRDVKPSDASLQQFLSDLAAREGIIPPDFQPVGIDEQGRLDEKAKVTCPNCGEVFEPKG